MSINENSPPSTEMSFTIYGDPIPIGNNSRNELFYSEYEVNLLLYTITDLIVGHIFVPFTDGDTIQVEILFHLRETDVDIQDDSLHSLGDKFVQIMAGIFYSNIEQVQQIITYKALSTDNSGSTNIVLKNFMDEINDEDLDE